MSKKTFNINKELYPELVVSDAIGEFLGYQISFSNSLLTIEDENPQFVFDELMNYVLFISLENPLGA